MDKALTNLKQCPPRSPRIRLGGFVILPRLLDKCRATLAGTNGEYHYDCPLDKRFLSYVGVNPTTLKAQVKKGLGDGDILKWIQKNAKIPHSGEEIALWSDFQEKLAPASIEEREFFLEIQKTAGPQRLDIVTWFDLLDLDDFVSYGGKP